MCLCAVEADPKLLFHGNKVLKKQGGGKTWELKKR